MMPFIVNRFAFIILTASAASLIYPQAFTWFSGYWITLGLGLIMFSMGIQLDVSDFKRVLKMPFQVTLGLLLQYLVMPLSGYWVAGLFQLPDDYATGLILVACCPGGTASNVIAYLARADVALSVILTSISTVIAIVMTPLLTTFYAGSRVNVPAGGLFLSTVQVVLVPVIAGLILRKYFLRYEKASANILSVAAVLIITLIVASIVGSGKKEILENGLRLPLAVFVLHASGFIFGYLLAFMTTKSVVASRTISIEVGMQNSGLGVVLARQNFVSPLTAIPSAISSLIHSLIGSLLAMFWAKRSFAISQKNKASEVPDYP